MGLPIIYNFSRMKLRHNKKAFTLIELLVVIAIIGILSGLIIVSMSGANNSAKDARIKADFDQLRTTAELYKLTTAQGYGYCMSGAASCAAIVSAPGSASALSTFMDSATDGSKLYSDIAAQGGTNRVMFISVSGAAYCIQASLNSGGWCIDSNGNNGAASVSCAAGNVKCD